MKKNIQLYLIVFLITFAGLFVYRAYQLTKENKKIHQELQETNQLYDENIQYNIRLEDSIKKFQTLVHQLQSQDNFSLKGNLKAQKYFKKFFPDMKKDWQTFIMEKLLQTNSKNKDNQLVPFAGMERNMKIDRAKVLNNHWIIAHFTDGTYSGEILIRYDIDAQQKVNFKVLDGILFP